MKPMQPRSLQRDLGLDTDKSGGVSYDEFHVPPRRGGAAEDASSGHTKQSRFSRLDTNSDGQISLAEFEARPKRRPQQTR